MLCQRCSGQTLGVFLPTFLLLLYFVSNIKSTSNWSMHAGLPHRNGKRNPAAYVTCLLMFQGKTGSKWNTFRNIWFKRKIWEELISRLYQYVSQLKFDKYSLNGILQPHARFCPQLFLRPAGTGLTHAYAVLQTLYFKMQIFSTSLLCYTSNCKLQETKIRRQTTIARGIRNS